jgi:competence protein ComEC
MIAYFKEEIPFFRHIWLFITGIGISIYLDKPIPYLLFYWMALLAFLLGFLIITFKRKIFTHNHIAGFLIALLFVLSGILFCDSSKEIYHPKHFSKFPSEKLIVVIDETPKIKGDIARFVVVVKGFIHKDTVNDAQGNLLLAMRIDTFQKFDYAYGDQLIIQSKFKETEPPYNPAEFNYKRFLACKQIYHQSFINVKETRKIASGKGNPIIDAALNFREKQVEKFRKYLKFKDSQSVASTLILGYRAELDQHILDAYSKTGTLHILSVSGMHVAIVVILLNWIFGRLDNYRYGKPLKLFLMISLIWFYSLITGLAPSILRAALMLTLVLIAGYRSKKINSFNIIAVAAFILLLYNPFMLMDVGFQLSFLAVLGLIYLQPKIYKLFVFDNKIIDFFWSCAAVSIAAQLATTAISLYYFHQFPVYFILSNLYMTIPAILIMYGGIFFLLLSFSDTVMQVLGFLLNYIIDYTNKGLIIIEQIPFANITQVWLGKSEILLFYATLIILISFRNEKHYLKVAMGLAILFIGIHSYSTLNHIKQHKAIFFSLRKNTAVAILKGRSSVLITDLEASDYTYRFSVKPYLDSCRISDIKFINPHQSLDEKIYFTGHKSLKIINHKNHTFNQSKTDWLLLSGDKIYNMPQLLETNEARNIFIDGRNRDFIIEGLKAQLQNTTANVAVLKRQKAVEIDLLNY